MVLEVLECSWEVACAHGLEGSHCGLLIVGASWCGSLKAFGLIRVVRGYGVLSLWSSGVKARCAQGFAGCRQVSMRPAKCFGMPGCRCSIFCSKCKFCEKNVGQSKGHKLMYLKPHGAFLCPAWPMEAHGWSWPRFVFTNFVTFFLLRLAGARRIALSDCRHPELNAEEQALADRAWVDTQALKAGSSSSRAEPTGLLLRGIFLENSDEAT